MLGDVTDRLLKSCAKHGYQFVALSNVIDIVFLQDYYTPFKQFGKGERSLWKNYLFHANHEIDSTSVNDRLLYVCTKIAEFMDRSESLLVHFNCGDKIFLNILEKKLTTNFTIVYNDSGASTHVTNTDILDILYARPNLPYVFTKKSSIKNIILELQNTTNKRHAYSYRPMKLGLDISMNSTGAACSCIDANGHIEVLFGTLKTKRTAIDIQRLPQIIKLVKYAPLIDNDGNKYYVDLRYAESLCIEGGALAAVHGAFRIGQFSGSMLAEICREGPSKKVFYVAPTSLKKLITGYGRSGKGLMVVKIKKMLKISQDINDDEADALCLLHCLIDKNISLKDENLT